MGIIWLALGIFMISRPVRAQAIMNGQADWFRKGSWHPIRGMPAWLIRMIGILEHF